MASEADHATMNPSQLLGHYAEQISAFRSVLQKNDELKSLAVDVSSASALQLLRFLLARDLDVSKAEKMYVEYWRWINSGAKQINRADLVREFSQNKAFIHKTDNEGRPTAYMLACNHDANARIIEETIKVAIFILSDLESRMDEEKGICQFTAVADLANFGWSNFDLQAPKECFSILLKYFPERLGKLYFINTGFVFWALWKVLSPLLPERTKAKIVFLRDSSAYLPVFEKDFPKENLPIAYGGSDPVEFKFNAEKFLADEPASAPVPPLSPTTHTETVSEKELKNDDGTVTRTVVVDTVDVHESHRTGKTTEQRVHVEITSTEHA